MSEPRNPPVRDLTPEEVALGLAEDRMILVDVREPNEIAVESYPGAVVVPLSTFDPAEIPDPQGRAGPAAAR
jgi:rhodanese-related sulfurtransferase